MAITWASFTATPLFGRAALRFPGSGSIGEIEIPLHITKLSSQDEGSTLTEISYGPLIDFNSNLGSGGTTVGLGPNKLSKITIEGFIDTPYVNSATPLPGIKIDNNFTSYGEIIAAFYEGRTTTGSQGFWQQVSPRWFRDGYGRVYGDASPTGPNQFIRIWDLTVQKVEAVPTRENFTMVLQV